jgi:hypothetical protein
MGFNHCRRATGTLGIGLFLVLAAGCGGKGYERYVPSQKSARAALETALTAWQNGQPPGRIESGSPAIQATDSQWKAGKKLASYEIVDEEPGDGPVWFSVRLKLQNAKKEQVVRYVVVGKDPLWVYREDDYKQVTNW